MARQPKRYRKKAEAPREPIPFILEFERLDGKVEEVAMEALGIPPLGYAKSLVDAYRRDPDSGVRYINTGAGRILSVMNVLRVVLTAASREQLDLLVNDPDVKVDFAMLTQVFEDLTTEYASMDGEVRPTSPSPSSSGGQPTTEPGSTDNALSTAANRSDEGS